MQKFLQLVLWTTGLLLSFRAFAETVIVPRAANVRSSKDFYGRENVLDQLPQGSKVEIISRRSLLSGADALEVKIISPENKLSLNEKKPIYIWQSKNEIKNDLFKTESGVACTNCTAEPVQAPVPTNDIKNIVNKIEEQQSEVATTSATEEKKAQFTGNLADAIKKYSESIQVQKSFEWANNNVRRGNGMCYRHTKEALAVQTKAGKGMGNNLIPKWYSSAKAKYGVSDLKKKGFVNLLDHDDYKDMNSKTAPHGAVLIYKHINRKGVEDKKAGHAEMKFDRVIDGKTVSQFFYGPLHSYPVNNREGSRYILIGIMIKSPISEGTN
jgi:hypothetical protein